MKKNVFSGINNFMKLLFLLNLILMVNSHWTYITLTLDITCKMNLSVSMQKHSTYLEMVLQMMSIKRNIVLSLFNVKIVIYYFRCYKILRNKSTFMPLWIVRRTVLWRTWSSKRFERSERMHRKLIFEFLPRPPPSSRWETNSCCLLTIYRLYTNFPNTWSFSIM